jgi:hypothetical protein
MGMQSDQTASMKIPNLKQFCCANVLALVFSLAGFGQIAQTSPELCGKSKDTFLAVPGNVHLTPSEGGTTLQIQGSNHLTTGLHISGLETVKQICAVPGNTLVVFSVFDDDFTYDTRIVGEETGHVTEIDAFDPVISPNGRWMAFRVFRPRILNTTFSEEYGLYELSNAQGQRVMYPEVLGHAPFLNIGVPEEQVHEFRAATFFWASDSNSVLFADSLNRRLFLVWVRIEEDGSIVAYVHPVSVSEICDDNSRQIRSLTDLSHAEVVATSDPAVTEFRAEFGIEPTGSCIPKTLVLHSADFSRAVLEHYTPR